MNIGADVPASIRVLLADMTVSAGAMVDTLLGDGRFHLVGTVSAAAELSDAIARFAPHVLVITTGGIGSARKNIEALRLAHAHRAGLRSIALLDGWRDDLIVEAFRAGATGVLSAQDSPAMMAKCIHSVHLGQIWANSSQLKMVLQILGQQSVPRSTAEKSGGREVLTPREIEVINAVAEGMTNRGIASHLNLSEHTVKNYLFRVFDKLGVSNRAELLMLSLTLGRPKETLSRR